MRTLLVATLAALLAGCNNKSDKSSSDAVEVDPVVHQEKDDSSRPRSGRNSTADNGGTGIARADEDGTAPRRPAAHSRVQKIIDKYVETGVDGVVDVMVGKDGRINKVIVVGAEPIRTTLGAADGLLTARRQARLTAAGKFRQFIKEKVTMSEKTENERIIKLEGKGDSLKEEGKKIEKFTEKYETISEGMVRGLQTLGYKTVSLNKKEKIYVVVMGWDHKTSELTKKLDKELESDDTGDDGTPGSAQERRKLKDQSGVAPGAKDFFDK